MLLLFIELGERFNTSLLIKQEPKMVKTKKNARRSKGSKWEPKPLKTAPHSFVIKRGKIGKNLQELLADTRTVMEPFTATQLKVLKKNSVRDFVSVASCLNVTHMLIFTRTEKCAYLRLCRLPRGPTLTYKIVDFTLTKDVTKAQRRPYSSQKMFANAPLIILKSFNEATSSEEVNNPNQLQTIVWQSLFPSLDIRYLKLPQVKRCCLLRLDPDTGNIEFRHYAIRVKPVGVSKPIKRLITHKKIPDLGKFHDIDEAFEDGGMSSGASDGEEDELDTSRHVETPSSSKLSQTNKSAVRLVELGPRLTLKLHKIQDGLLCGTKLFGN